MSTTAIALVKVGVKLEGLPPGLLFQSKGLMEENENDAGGKKKPPRSLREQAELRAHWTGRGKSRQLCIPSRMFYLSFCQAAMDFQQPNKKTSNMSFLLGPTLAFEEDKIPLGTSKFEVLEEYARIPPTGKTCVMVKIGRPLLRKWSVAFNVLVDDEQWEVGLLEDIIVHAGKVCGIGAWRPRLKGPYGRFRLLDFKVARKVAA